MAGRTNTTAQIQRNYLAKDFADIRADLVRYASTFYSSQIKDFSESGLGGMFIDLAASVGDTMTFYLDHQFNELSWSDAIELQNVEKHLLNAGVKITGASPSTVEISYFIEVPSVLINGSYVPLESSLPIIQAGTTCISANRKSFTLMDDVNFGEKDSEGFLKATVRVGEIDGSGNPTTFVISRTGIATSSVRTSEVFSVPSGYNPFFTISILNSNVSRIVSVTDTEGNKYYEVDSLTQDTVYAPVTNISYDSNLVSDTMEIIPASRRFTVSTSLTTRTSSLTFGGGENSSNEETAFDPSSLALPLYGKNPVGRYSVDPNKLLRSNTLGIAPSNTTLTVVYEYGGGLDHNVPVNSIRSVSSLNIAFPGVPSNSIATSIRASVDVINLSPSSGGASQPSINELRLQIPASRNSQLRVVTKDDLLARVYTLPTKFGKVSKAGCRLNPNNPQAKMLYILGFDSSGSLTKASDTLKMNLRNYLNGLRLISDAVDIVDSPIVNVSVRASIIVSPNSISIEVLQSAAQAIRDELNISDFQVDQPIIIADIISAVINTPGVLSLVNLEFYNMSGNNGDTVYSSFQYDIENATTRGIIIPPPGGIFEVKYPTSDVVVIST
jgi:hypothetical protein